MFTSTMIFVLVVGYLLVVTNPPQDLLQYDENKQCFVPKDIPILDLWQYSESVMMFIGFFGLVSVFIGEMATSVFLVFKKYRKKPHFEIDVMFIPAVISIIVLGLIPLPYFGYALSMMMILIGLPAFILGVLIGLPYKIRFWRRILILQGFIGLFFSLWIISIVFRLRDIANIFAFVEGALLGVNFVTLFIAIGKKEIKKK